MCLTTGSNRPKDLVLIVAYTKRKSKEQVVVEMLNLINWALDQVMQSEIIIAQKGVCTVVSDAFKHVSLNMI